MSTVKGWCPGAYRPMQSGDGLIVRVRPRLGHLTAEQVHGLCKLSLTLGNGLVDLTSRANLQMRGVQAADHDAVLSQLAALDLLDADPETEARRNILTTPHWSSGDVTERLYHALVTRLVDLPDLPAKMGVALDTGPSPILGEASADFRFERGADGGVILRADGATQGHLISEENAMQALIDMAEWFVRTGGAKAGRMRRHLSTAALPSDWHSEPVAMQGHPLQAGPADNGQIFGAPFGSLEASALSALMIETQSTAMRCTPWRLFLLENAKTPVDAQGFVTDPNDPVLNAHACPGAPACNSATVETRALARALAAQSPAGLHVSGCAKGCAFPRRATRTFTGNNGRYDLVENGHPWDQPSQRGLSAHDLMTLSD